MPTTSMASLPPDNGPVAALLAGTDALSDVLAGLHARVQEATGATCSVLLELAPETERLHPTSGRGLEQLAAEPWCTDEVSRTFAREVLSTGRPRQIAPIANACPTLARRLRTPAAYLAPVRFAGQPLGLLVLGLREVTPPLGWAGQVSECAAGFALALTYARLRQDLAVQADINTLVHTLGEGDATSLPPERFVAFCSGVARAFAADRVELWRHVREAHRIELAAASPPAAACEPMAVDADDGAHRVTVALRQLEPTLTTRIGPGPYALPHHAALLPLRGRRRALGVLVLDGLRLGPGDSVRLKPHLVSLATQLAGLLESTQLLDDVVRAWRELENTFDSMRDPLAVCGPDGRVLRANEAFARFAGRPRSALRYEPLGSLVDPHVEQWLTRAMRAAAANSTDIQTTDVTDTRTSRILHVTVTALATRQDLAEGFVVILRDVTDERRLESERAALRERLAQSETLSHLVAGIAHEINNPLQAVTGHVELVRHTTALPAPADAQLALVHREADRAARIVRNLLLLAGSGRIVVRSVSVNAAVKRAIANRRRAWREGSVRVQQRLDPGLPRIGGDALLLQQAVLNVLLNAEQALGDGGGTIDVTTRMNRVRSRVEVLIRDDGPGIPDDVLPKVFDPFFTTKEAGRGLGLALVLRIVQEHGGDITARNRPEGGAEFALHFPAPTVLK